MGLPRGFVPHNDSLRVIWNPSALSLRAHRSNPGYSPGINSQSRLSVHINYKLHVILLGSLYLTLMLTPLPFVETASAAVYKWYDENGKVHITDDATKVPEKNWDKTKPDNPSSDTSKTIEDKSSIEEGIAAFKRKDYLTAYEKFKPSADKGNATIQNIIGVMYDAGLGVAQNHKESMTWFKLAANQGNAEAQTSVGLMYQLGQGVDQDYKEAAKWFSMAADQGNPEAQTCLGLIYKSGQGVNQDYKEAIKWLTLAAEQGLPVAQSNLGGMYANGLGVKKDYVQARKWYNIAISTSAKKSAGGNKERDTISKKMSARQIAEADRLAKEWKKSHIKIGGTLF